MNTDFLGPGTSLVKTPTEVIDIYEVLSNKLNMKNQNIFMLGFCIGYRSGERKESTDFNGKEFRTSYLSSNQRGILYAVGINEEILNEKAESYTDQKNQAKFRKLYVEYSTSGLLKLKEEIEENGKSFEEQDRLDLLSGILQYFIESKEESPF